MSQIRALVKARNFCAKLWWREETLVYFVAAKMSSNFFFRIWPSPRGQLESSWWTKITFSRTACPDATHVNGQFNRNSARQRQIA